MQRIAPHQPHPLYNTAATRRIEQAAAAALPPHTLMQRAGLAVARLAQALAPHARTVWIACGPGNNGGDGLEAALHLQRSGRQVVVTWLGDPDHAPADARASWQRAQGAGVHCEHDLQWADAPPTNLTAADLCIDALLGLGASSRVLSRATAPARQPDPRLLACLHALRRSPAPVLAIDLPSGLDADTGQFAPGLAPHAEHPTHRQPAHHTLSLLTLKPGLFTAAGRDAAGSVWWDDLGVDSRDTPPSAWLSGPAVATPRAHASHKGSYGDVAVVGGEGLAERGLGMGGAALLAASAALHAGAGRVLVALLDNDHLEIDPQHPELMLRRFEALALEQLTVVCGCGGGQAVGRVLADVIPRAARLVLDADALNAIAAQAALHALVVARGSRACPPCSRPTRWRPRGCWACPPPRCRPTAWVPRTSWRFSSMRWQCSRAPAPWWRRPTGCPPSTPPATPGWRPRAPAMCWPAWWVRAWQQAPAPCARPARPCTPMAWRPTAGRQTGR